MDWLDLFAVQGTLKSLLQYHSSKASILQCSAFFIVHLSYPYMTTGKTIALTRRTFVGKIMSLLFRGGQKVHRPQLVAGSSSLPAWNKCSAADCFASRGEESIHAYLTAAAKSLQSCLTPCDPTDGSPPGSPIPGILQARILEWAAISFSSLPFFPVPVLSPTLSGKCHFNSGTIPCKSHWRCVPDSCYFCSAIPCSLHLSIVSCLILFFLFQSV